jgi:hypothetical protein
MQSQSRLGWIKQRWQLVPGRNEGEKGESLASCMDMVAGK